MAAKTHGTTKNRRAGQMRFPGAADNRFIERPALPAVGLANEHAQQLALARQLHASTRARAAPAHTASRPSSTCAPTFSSAAAELPSRSSAIVSYPKLENVV